MADVRQQTTARSGLDALRDAVVRALGELTPQPAWALAATGPGVATAGAVRPGRPAALTVLLSLTDGGTPAPSGGDGIGPVAGADDSALATSSELSESERSRLIALVELARGGDADAFGELFDHYHPSVYRFLFYRVRSVAVAEDLASETFLRALRNMTGFRWQGKDFGAWLMTIARNLSADHFKAGRTRLETVTEDMGDHDDTTEGPESLVMASITNELLLEALGQLAEEQRDCLVMRFLQGMSIAETALVLDRSEGAVKQLQLRGVRNLAKLMPEGVRDR